MRAACVLTAGMIGLSTSSGCGTYLVDDGLYPLPAIHIVWPTPSDVGLTYEDVQLTSTNGQMLNAWYMPADNARATVLVHHGAVSNRGAAVAHYLLLHELGCNVFAYDYQGFGENWSLATLATVMPDASTALAYVQQRAEADGLPIVLFGASLGTTAAFAQAAESPTGAVGVVIEGTCTPQNLAPLTYLMIGMTPSPESYLDFPDELNPVLTTPRITLPKLFIHSSSDTTSPIAGAEALFETASEPKTFETFGGEHLMALGTEPERYSEVWETFLDSVVPVNTP